MNECPSCGSRSGDYNLIKRQYQCHSCRFVYKKRAGNQPWKLIVTLGAIMFLLTILTGGC